jgi:integrase/recombinase XerD
MTRLFSSLVLRITVYLSAWLEKNAPEKWEHVVIAHSKKGTAGVAPTAKSAHIANKNTRPESLYQQGSSGGSGRHLKELRILPEWAREIEPFLMNQLSDHTRRAYETDLKQFFLFLEGKVDAASLRGLRTDHVIAYRKALEEGRLHGRPMAKSTINRKLAVIKSFFNWLKLNHIASENPAQLVKGFPQSQESNLKGLSDEETVKVLEGPRLNTKSGALHLAILYVLFYLGLRKGELMGLKMGDLDTERGVDVLKVRGKGHRIRILPLTGKVKYALEHYFYVCQRDRGDKEAPLFTPTRNPRFGVLTRPLTPYSITYLVQKYAKMSGILKPISPHSCRATCISNALDKRATHRSVQHLAGWSTPLMIQRYDKRREDLKNSAAFLIDYGAELPA